MLERDTCKVGTGTYPVCTLEITDALYSPYPRYLRASLCPSSLSTAPHSSELFITENESVVFFCFLLSQLDLSIYLLLLLPPLSPLLRSLLTTIANISATNLAYLPSCIHNTFVLHAHSSIIVLYCTRLKSTRYFPCSTFSCAETLAPRRQQEKEKNKSTSRRKGH